MAVGLALRARHPTLPVELVTGYGQIPASAAGLFAAVLGKPSDPDEIEAILRRLVPAPAPQR